jgi:hypothetical protein
VTKKRRKETPVRRPPSGPETVPPVYSDDFFARWASLLQSERLLHRLVAVLKAEPNLRIDLEKALAEPEGDAAKETST